MPEVEEQAVFARTPSPDPPRHKVMVINDPEGLPSEWCFERSPQRNDVIAGREDGILYKVLGTTSFGELLLEGFASKLQLEEIFGPSESRIQAWRRW